MAYSECHHTHPSFVSISPSHLLPSEPTSPPLSPLTLTNFTTPTITPSRALWRGIGPALMLVINPVIQYTVFEQLKNILIARRTRQRRALKGASAAVAVLTDWDFFLLGALSKLIATGSTYPYMCVSSCSNLPLYS